MCWRLGTNDLQEVRAHLEAALTEAIAQAKVKREPCWTESLAVGSAGFVQRIEPLLLSRRETEVIDMADGVSVLREPAFPYGQERGSKSEAKPPN